MAILAGGLLVVPEEPEIITPPTVAYREDVGTMTASWIDPTGIEWPLSTTDDELGWFTMNGPASWGAAPIELVTDELSRGGEQVRFIRNKPRRLQWPIYVFGDDHQQYIDRMRRIVRAFTMTSQRKSHGYLRIQRPDGRYREIACYYEQGFEGEAEQGHLWSKHVITLYCPDGYWSGDRPITAERSFTAPENPDVPGQPASFYTRFMYVTSSQIVSAPGAGETANTEINNPGDVDAWPVWTITGPATKVTCVNATLGLRFAVTYTLTAGQSITITTNRPTVRGPGDANLSKYVDWFNVAGGAYLWPLTDGVNQILFQVDGAGTGTKIQMAFTPRHETA
jgi:hypothetical protein